MSARPALLALCAAACFPCGFNLVAIGMVAPHLTVLLGLTTGALAPVFIASGVGNVVGNLVLGPLADRVGRKAVIVGGLLASAPFVLGSAHAASVAALTWSQLAANFLLMGTLPVVLTVAGGEYIPRARKTRAVMTAWLGFMAGMILAGAAVASLPAAFAARAVFAINAAAIVAIAALVWLCLPAAPPAARDHRAAGFPVRQLFAAGRARLTLLLWTMFIANLSVVFFLTSWLVTLLHGEGIAETTAVALTTLLNVGSAAGGVAIVAFVERRGRMHFGILAPAFLLGGCFVAAVGFVGPAIPLAALVVFLAGFWANGTQNTATTMVATLYPVAIRSTGASWAIGIGQCGQILGSLAGAALLAAGFPTSGMFAIIALGTLVAAACALLVDPAARTLAES